MIAFTLSTPAITSIYTISLHDALPILDGQKVVVLEWDKPDERENGDYLEESEIGGYEIRYRKPGQEDYETVIIDDGLVEKYEFTQPAGTAELENASYDSAGLYSVFITLCERETVPFRYSSSPRMLSLT